jgi:hypothetical protein
MPAEHRAAPRSPPFPSPSFALAPRYHPIPSIVQSGGFARLITQLREDDTRYASRSTIFHTVCILSVV